MRFRGWIPIQPPTVRSRDKENTMGYKTFFIRTCKYGCLWQPFFLLFRYRRWCEQDLLGMRNIRNDKKIQKLFHPIVEKHANCSRDCALTCKSYQFISLFSDEGTTYDFLCSPTWLVGTWHALPDQISAPSWSLYTPLKHTAQWSKICTLWILCRIFLP